MRSRTAARALTLAAMGSLGVAAPGAAAATKSETVSASSAYLRACHTELASSRSGRDTFRVTARSRGLVHVKLSAADGDWDVGVFGKKGRRVAGAAGFGSSEVASGFVRKGERLTVQACRLNGNSSKARVRVSLTALRAGKAGGKVSVVDVRARGPKAKRRLQTLGLDLTEHGDRNSVEVVLHGKADARKLRRAGFRYTVRIGDLAARTRANARKDARFARATAASDLPSMRDSYRRLPDYEFEMKELARRYPGLVKPLVLPHKTVEGRNVYGIEVTRRPHRTGDGKPVFLMLGVHHAREWPSSEHTLEFAYDLVKNFSRERRTRNLVRQVRTIFVPLVNPDGFNVSREAAPLGDFSLFDYEMKRKNCRVSAFAPPEERGGTCNDNPQGAYRGTDPNRNYGGLWGGAGASTNPLDPTYRGDGPFSEPETQNIHELVQERQVTNLITNHTYSNLVLRPPGVADFGPPLEEPQYEELGARMTAHNGYANLPSYGLYDTTGATEDYTFWTAGGLGFTFEIGPDEFHPPYETGVVAEYLGREPAAGAGKGGNREAYYEMLNATRERALHGLITGYAPEGSRLQIRKDFMTSTSPVWNNDYGTDIGEAMQFPDFLVSDLISDGSRFEWHVNPSTRPVVAGRHGRDPNGPPQAAIPFANPAGIPAENTESFPTGPNESIPFTVQGPEQGVDNGRFTVHIEWTNPETDWDLYVTNADTGEIVTQSAAFGDTTEDATLFDPPPGNYIAHVVNYDQVQDPPDDWTNGSISFQSPRPRTENPEKESWTLTCFNPQGTAVAARQVVVDRGQMVQLGDVCTKETQAAKAARQR